MIEKNNLDISMRAFIQPLLEGEQIPFSERNFSTIFLYREAHSWELVSLKDHKKPVGFIGKTYDNLKCFFPLEEQLLLMNEASILLPQLIEEEHIEILYPLTEKTARKLSIQGLPIQTEANDSDYIMDRKTIETYAGRALDGRRNLVHQFLRLGEINVEALSERTIPDALKILDIWDQHTSARTDLVFEKKASREGVILFQELCIEGWIAYLDKQPVALWYGQPLNKNMYLIHCAKAVPNIKGAYQYIHQEAAKRLSPHYLYLNWEQDLGLEGLRKSKLAYDPSRFEDKWRVQISPHSRSTYLS